MQETRVRGTPTVDQAIAAYDQLASPVFLSYELLQLYGKKYLESVSQQLGFPIAVSDPRLETIMNEDTNSKYFSAIKHHPTDDLAQHSSRKWR
jgi:hypothetical protein